MHNESNDGVAFATVSEDREQFKKTNKKKDVMRFRCKKTGHTQMSVKSNCLIPNCNITRQDILQAEYILGPNLGSIKGKTTRCATDHVHKYLEISLRNMGA